MIELTIDKSTAPKDWEKRANNMMRAYCERTGEKLSSLEFFIHLPERGRCFFKPVGAGNVDAHG